MTFFPFPRCALSIALASALVGTVANAAPTSDHAAKMEGRTSEDSKASAGIAGELLCAPGATKVAKDGLGLYDTGSGLSLGPVKAGQPCTLLATGAGLSVQFSGQGALLLAGPVNYRLNQTPRRAEFALAEPALCESYYSATDRLTLRVTDTNAVVQDLPGIRRVDYIPGSARFVPDAVEGTYGPTLQCHAFPFTSLIANPPTVPAPPAVNPDLIFASGFDDSASIALQLLTGDGANAIRKLDVTRDQSFAYRIRITNTGAVPASGIRLREFVPVPAATPLLTPVVTAGTWTCSTAAGPCSGAASGSGVLNQASITLAAGESRTYVLNRTVTSGAPPQRTLLAAAVFFNPEDATGGGDRVSTDNSAPLVLELVPNQGPEIACAGLSSPLNLLENPSPVEYTCTLSDPEGDAITGLVLQSNSNTTLLPSAGMLTTGSAPNTWTLRFAPATDQLGSSTVVLRSTDSRLGTRDLTIVVNVADVNSPPSFALFTQEIRMSPTGGLPRDAAGQPIDSPNVVRGSNCPSQDVCSLTFPNFLINRSLGVQPESPSQQLQASVSCAPHSTGVNPFEVAPSITPSTPQAVGQPFALGFTYRKANFDPAPNPAVEVVCTITVADTGSPPLDAQRTLRIVFNN